MWLLALGPVEWEAVLYSFEVLGWFQVCHLQLIVCSYANTNSILKVHIYLFISQPFTAKKESVQKITLKLTLDGSKTEVKKVQDKFFM